MALTPTRQALWQRDHRARGLCILCSRPTVTKNHCAEHIERIRARDRKRKLWDKVKNRCRGRVLCSGCGGIGHNARTCTALDSRREPPANWNESDRQRKDTMPMKPKPLPRLPKRCPLCKTAVVSRLCRVCQRPEVFCGCTMGDHDYSLTERRARKTWLARIAAKRKAAKGS